MSEERAAVADPNLRLLGVKDVAAILGTDKENVLAWIRSGALPAVKVGRSGEPRVSVLMLEAWQRSLATSQPTSQKRAPRRASGRPRTPLEVVR